MTVRPRLSAAVSHLFMPSLAEEWAVGLTLACTVLSVVGMVAIAAHRFRRGRRTRRPGR